MKIGDKVIVKAELFPQGINTPAFMRTRIVEFIGQKYIHVRMDWKKKQPCVRAIADMLLFQ